MKRTRIALSIFLSAVFMTFAVSCGDDEDDNKVSPPNSQTTTEEKNDNAGGQRDSSEVQRDSTVTYVVTNEVVSVSDYKTLILTFTQAPVSVAFAGQTGTIMNNGDGTWEVVFYNITATSGNLAVNFGTGFEAYNKTISFGKADALQIEVPAIRKATQKMNINDGSVAPDTNGNYVVSNDADNQNDKQFGADNSEAAAAQVTATIAVPATNTKQDGSAITEDFSIVVFTPANEEATNESALRENQIVSEEVLGIKCEPDGVAFSNPVQVAVNIPDAEGYDIKLRHEGTSETVAVTDLGGDVFSAMVPHFSTWLYYLNAKIVQISSEMVLADQGQITVQNDGKQSITYKKYVGYEIIGDVPPIVKQYLAGVFSVKKRQISNTLSFMVPSEGTATWSIRQTVRTFVFQSGTRMFRVRFYSDVVPSVEFAGYGEDTEKPINNVGGSN